MRISIYSSKLDFDNHAKFIKSDQEDIFQSHKNEKKKKKKDSECSICYRGSHYAFL